MRNLPGAGPASSSEVSPASQKNFSDICLSWVFFAGTAGQVWCLRLQAPVAFFGVLMFSHGSLSRVRARVGLAVVSVVAMLAAVAALPAAALTPPEPPPSGGSCPSGAASAYLDVSVHSFAYDDSRCLRELGISDAGDLYRPGDDMTRSEMAAFMANAYAALTGTPAPVVDHVFADVSSDPNADDIARIFGLGITQGTSDTTYSPDDSVIRGHMALFLTRLYKAVAGSDAPAAGTPFTDIGDRAFAERAAIGAIYALGVTTGTSATTYSPHSNVTREQMASFVARMFRVIDAAAEVPGVPTGLTAEPATTDNGDRLVVSWTVAAGLAARYVVQWRTDNEDFSVARQLAVPREMYAFTLPDPGETFAVRVSAVTGFGQSAWSEEVAWTAPDIPGPVTALEAVPGHEQLKLSWAAPDDDGGSEITGYVVSWRTGRQASADTADVAGDAASYTITGLDNSKSYSVTVQAVNAAGTGEAASVPAGDSNAAVTPVPTKSTAPQNLTVTQVHDGDGTSLDVSWSAPAADGGTVLVNYSIQSRCGDATVWDPDPAFGVANVETRQVQTAQLTGLTAGDACEVRVRANSYDDNNANDFQDVADEPTLNSLWAVASGTPVTLPGTPLNAAVNRAHRSLQATWDAPVSDGGSDITGYKIIWDAGVPADVTVPAEPTSYTITGLSNSYQYAVSVKAVTAVGESATAAVVAASDGTQPRAVPAAPASVRAGLASLTLPNGDPNLDAGTSLVVAWAAPPANGTEPVKGYVVQRRTSAVPDNPETPADDPTPAGFWTAVSFTADDVEKRTVVVTGLTAGTSYDFQVQATNDHDDDDSTVLVGGLWSAPVSATPSTLPDPVTVEAADIVGGHLSLTVAWAAPVVDGGSDITSYVVNYASQNGHDQFLTRTVQAPLTRVTLTGLSNGVAYLVQIQAVNARGSGPVLDQQDTSDPDDQGVVGTPAPRPDAPASVTAVPEADGDGSRVAVSWSPVTQTNAQGPVASYQVQFRSDAGWVPATVYAVDEDGLGASALAEIPPSTASVSVATVVGTEYQVRVRAVTTIGSAGSWGYVSGTVTAAGTPAAPANVAVDAVDEREVASTVAVTWDSVAEAQSASSDITGFVVSWFDSGDLVAGDRGSAVIGRSTVGSYAIQGLSPGSYSVTVAAVNHVGVGAASAAVSATVPAL